jgi:hypothetical protein
MILHPDAERLVREGRAQRFSGASAGRAERAWREAAAEERRDTGMIVPIVCGVTVRTDPAKLRGADDEVAQQDGAMAGLVLGPYQIRDDDGHYRIGWRVWNPFVARNNPRRFARWPESVIDFYATERTDPYVLSRWVRRMVAILGEHPDSLLDDQAGQILDDARRLCAVVLTRGKATE